jgi:hypothetical protein
MQALRFLFNSTPVKYWLPNLNIAGVLLTPSLVFSGAHGASEHKGLSVLLIPVHPWQGLLRS